MPTSGGYPRIELFGLSVSLLKLNQEKKNQEYIGGEGGYYLQLVRNSFTNTNLLLVLEGLCNFSINSDSIDIKGSGFGEELNQSCHLLHKKTLRLKWEKSWTKTTKSSDRA